MSYKYTLKDSIRDNYKDKEFIEELNEELYATLGKGNFTPFPNIYLSMESFFNEYKNAEDKSAFLERLNWILEFAEADNDKTAVKLASSKFAFIRGH